MEPLEVVLYLVATVVGLVIFYFIVKTAVRNGYIEARRDILAVEKRAADEAAAKADATKNAPPAGGEVW